MPRYERFSLRLQVALMFMLALDLVFFIVAVYLKSRMCYMPCSFRVIFVSEGGHGYTVRYLKGPSKKKEGNNTNSKNGSHFMQAVIASFSAKLGLSLVRMKRGMAIWCY